MMSSRLGTVSPAPPGHDSLRPDEYHTSSGRKTPIGVKSLHPRAPDSAKNWAQDAGLWQEPTGTLLTCPSSRRSDAMAPRSSRAGYIDAEMLERMGRLARDL